MKKIGFLGDTPEYIKDHASVKRKINRIVDLFNYQYAGDVILNVYGDIGVGLWTLECCSENKIRYHLFLPCTVDVFSAEWYDYQQKSLEQVFKNAWATSIYSQTFNLSIENEVYRHIVDTSDLLVCFWNGMRQGKIFESVAYALKHNKIILDGMDDLKLITNKKVLAERVL